MITELEREVERIRKDTWERHRAYHVRRDILEDALTRNTWVIIANALVAGLNISEMIQHHYVMLHLIIVIMNCGVLAFLIWATLRWALAHREYTRVQNDMFRALSGLEELLEKAKRDEAPNQN